jgi:uncharacterized membrane-anchored protein YjiN (DUF445 family)
MPKGNTYRKIDSDTIKEITLTVIACLKEEEAKTAKTRHNRKRANTKALLRNYRSFVEHSDSAIYDATHLDEEETKLTEVLEQMSENSKGNLRVESIKESVARTRLIITHINEMLERYKIMCERSPKPEDLRRYKIVYAMYISPEIKSADEIACDNGVDRSTVYRDVDMAIERITALIFGIDGIHYLRS